jgi:hypothetical protein
MTDGVTILTHRVVPDRPHLNPNNVTKPSRIRVIERNGSLWIGNTELTLHLCGGEVERGFKWSDLGPGGVTRRSIP